MYAVSQERGALPRGRPTPGGEDWLANPVLPEDILREAVPGNIRRAEHFCSFLRQLVHYMQERISVNNVEQESCTIFLAALQEQMSVDGTRQSCPDCPDQRSCPEPYSESIHVCSTMP